jgi:hypothetical protein
LAFWLFGSAAFNPVSVGGTPACLEHESKHVPGPSMKDALAKMSESQNCLRLRSKSVALLGLNGFWHFGILIREIAFSAMNERRK